MLAGEGGSVAGDDPELDVGRCFADEGGDDAGESAEVDLDLVVDGIAREADDGAGVVAEVGDDELDQARLGGGYDHGDGGLVVGRAHVFGDDGDEAVGEVGRKFEVVGLDVFLAVFAGSADGDVAVGFDEDLHGMGERRTLLDAAVGDEVEGVVLGVDGGFVVGGAVFVAEEGFGDDAVAVDVLEAVAGRDDVAAGVAELEEAVEGALDVTDGHGVGVESRGGGAEEREDEGPGQEVVCGENFHRRSGVLL